MQTVIRCFALLGLILLMPLAVHGQDDGQKQAQVQYQLQKQIQSQNSSIAEQREDIANLKKSLEELDDQNRRLSDELAQSKATTTAAVGDLKKAQLAAAESNQANQQQLQTQVQGLQGTISGQKAEIIEQSKTLENLDKRHTDLSNELQVKTKSTMDSIQEMAKTLEGKIEGKMEGRLTDVKSTLTLGVNTNIVWTLVTGYLVMFMQAGFALVETGFTRSKNVAHTMMMNFMVYTIAMLGFWVCGFAIQFGGTGDPNSVGPITSLGDRVTSALNQEFGFSLGGCYFGLAGYSGFFLSGKALEGGVFALFLFQMVFMDTAATIPTGAMAERWKFLSFCIFSFFVGAFIYPVFGNWVWGGGWLAALGKNFHLGHGHVDFAGSSVVHMVGGVMAFVGAKILGPRIGKYTADGRPNPIPGHNIPMAILGTFILAFGWFGFNPGSTLCGTDPQIGVIATNTMLASAGGAVAAMLIAWIRIGTPDPSLSCNGMLAGLVAITAPCAFVDSWAAIALGAIAGGIMYISVFFVEEQLRIDDPVGAISVHGACGAWGVISLGIFANGTYGTGWNSVDGNVVGILYGNHDFGQLLAECIGVTTNIIFVGGSSWVILTLVGLLVGNRSSAADEVDGLDIPEMGALGYTDAK